MIGTCKWFSESKGYGFIVPDDGSKDVFVHANSLARSHVPPLKETQRVEFEVAAGRKGSEAINVRLI